MKTPLQAGDVEITFEVQKNDIDVVGACRIALVPPEALLSERERQRLIAQNFLYGGAYVLEIFLEQFIEMAAEAENGRKIEECRNGDLDFKDSS